MNRERSKALAWKMVDGTGTIAVRQALGAVTEDLRELFLAELSRFNSRP